MSNNSRIHLHYFVVCTALSAFTAAPCSAELPFTTVHKFNGTDGDSPQSGLSVLGTSLYGTTNAWGANGYGTLFSVSTLDQTFAKLHDFSPPAEGYLVLVQRELEFRSFGVSGLKGVMPVVTLASCQSGLSH